MQRIFNVDKWTEIDQGGSLEFLNPRPRNVRLEVNSPQEVELYYICQKSGEVRFLALVKGRDVIEFGSTGPFEITVKGGLCAIFTNDGDDISLKPTAEQPFVKVMERRRRNPELEHIAYMMQLNMNKRLEQQAYDLEQLFERKAAALAAQQPAESVSSGTGTESAPSGDAGTSDSSASAVAGGSEGGDGVSS